MNFGFFVDQDTTRYCYLRLRRLKAAIKDEQIVGALAEELEVPGASGKNKWAAVERRIEELRSTKGSLWHEVPAPEVLAASIFKARKRAGRAIDAHRPGHGDPDDAKDLGARPEVDALPVRLRTRLRLRSPLRRAHPCGCGPRRRSTR